MYKLMLTFVLLLTISSVIGENQIDDIFNQAISSYENRDFESALEKFVLIENQGVINADLYYNIGNCYFRLNSIGRSILYYKLALKVKADHLAARRNLEHALSITKDAQKLETENVFRSFWLKAFNSISLNLLAILTLVIFFVIVVLISMMIGIYRNRENAIPIFVTILFIFVFVILLIVNVVKWQEYHSKDEAVLLSPSALGYSGPGEDFTRVFTIHEGIIFNIEKEDGSWCLIKLKNGLGGWIKKDTFEVVKFR
ncbi:MAG: hypothetical protein K9N07_02660 [Candidatus Cloacimonetes bacterium]|nr:hypothetical protein [Candidatus Cloacimonadota bacterium]